MTDSYRLGKRALTVAVAAATILWSVGFSAFVAPMTASAASAGDLIKGTTLSTVYYLAADGQRYAFPNEKAYMSWYTDFSGIQTLSDSALAAIPLAGNVVYRPGSRWIKIQSDAKTYAVTPQGQIRWIETEAVAQALAGANWNTFIDDVPDVFFVDYTVGTSLLSASNGYGGMLVEEAGKTWLLWNNQKREVTASGFSANRFQSRHVLPGDGVNLAGMTAGAMVTAREPGLVDAAQIGSGVTGGLSISLASDTPASATIPGGADSVEFAKFRLTANSGSANVNQIVLTLGGVGNVNNIDNVYLYNGNNRITDARSVNSTTRQVTFSGLNLNLSSGESMTLSVRADTSTAAGGGDTANFMIASASDVSGTATVSGNFPISGNTMSFSNTDAGSVTVTKNGTISSPTIGEEGAVIGKFEIEADTEDVTVRQITVNVDDAADHSNYALWSGSTKLATGSVEGDLVSFVLSNQLAIEDGDSENLEVSADIGGEAGDTIAVSIEEEVDVVAVGSDFNFNVSVDVSAYDASGGCDDSGDECSFSEIQGGELTFAFNGPSSDDIQIDGDDQVLMEFSITAEQAVEIQSLDIVIACSNNAALDCDADNTDDAGDDDGADDIDDGGLLNEAAEGAEPNLENITIRTASGQVWMGPEELSSVGSDASQTLTFDDNQNINGGQTLDLVVTADLTNEDGLEGESFQATIDMSSVEAEDGNGDTLAADEIVPSADIVGNDFTATNSALTVQVSTPPSSGTFVKGNQNVPVLGLAFEAGDASDVTVTDLVLNADGDTTVGGGVTDNLAVNDFVNSCSLYDSESGALVDGPESFDTVTEEADFENFSWTVEAGETSKLIVKCNFANVDADGGNNDEYNFFVDESEVGTDIQAEDADGDDVTAAVGTTGTNETVETVVITITNGGTLSMSLDGASPSTTIILGQTPGASISKFKFEANDEAFLVKELTLSNCLTNTADADGDCIDAGEETGADDDAGVADAVDAVAQNVKISYQNQAGATVTKTSFLSGGKVTFSGLDFFVPADATRTLSVTADTNSVSSVAAVSGSLIQLNLDAEVDGTSTFEAVGIGSGETIDESDVDTYVVANEMILHKTKPTVSLASGSPSGAGVPGLSEALRFTVAADSRGFVTLDMVTFRVSVSEISGGWADCDSIGSTVAANGAQKWELYDLDDASDKLDDDADWSFFQADGTACAALDTVNVGFARLNFEGDATHPAEEIGAGQTKTYVVKVDTTGAPTDASIRLDIPSQNELCDDDVEANDGTVNGTDGNTTCDAGEGTDLGGDDADDPAIRWDDDTEGDDIEGDFVKNLPVTGGTIVY